jgi:plastocyanin
MRFLRSRVAPAFVVVLAAVLASCEAQRFLTDPNTATLAGTVRDEATNPVLGVKIRIANTSIIQDVVSDSMGSFIIRDVTVGSYDLSIYTPANYVLGAGQQNPVPITFNDGQTLSPTINLRNAPGTPAAPTVAFIKILNFVYTPSTVRINVGGTVTWQNAESDVHTVTSESGNELSSGNMTRQQLYAHTFTKPGVYPFHCLIHEVMQGTVIVE